MEELDTAADEGQTDTERDHLRGSSLMLVGRVLSLVLNLVVQVVAVRYLGKTDYGVFAYAVSWSSIGASVALLGQDQSLGRFLPRYEISGQGSRAQGALVVAFATVTLIGSCIAALAIGMSALGVDLDGAVLAALLVALADVEVADRCSHRGSAGLELLVQALADLGCEVLGVELRDGGHDAVQQHPRGCLVDVLRRGHQGDPGFDQPTVNLHIVQAVAGEAVDLVDDAVGDLMRGDVLQHPLQVWPVS